MGVLPRQQTREHGRISADIPVMRILYLLASFSLIIGDKWSSLKSPYLEKKARHRELKEKVFKKDTGYYPKEKVKVNTKKKEKEKYKKASIITEENFLKNGRVQLCLTVEEDNVKNTLLKFGLATHMFTDVIKFRKTLKTLQDQVPTAKKQKKGTKNKLLADKKGTQVKPHQGNWVGRSMGVRDPQFLSYLFDDAASWNTHDGSNYLGKRRRRRQAYRDTMFNKLGGLKTRQRKGTLKVPGELPLCFGWKYLKALDALVENDTVDTEVLSQSVSDMLDVNFSQAVSSIITGCGESLSDNSPLNLCPPPDPETEACQDQCRVDTQCQYREMCCSTSCGGYKCIPRRPPKAHSCQTGDEFMQCIYQRINNQLCAEEN